MRGDGHSLACISDQVFDEFKRRKDEAMKRMGRDELTNDEFMSALLDVHSHHLRTETNNDTND